MILLTTHGDAGSRLYALCSNDKLPLIEMYNNRGPNSGYNEDEPDHDIHLDNCVSIQNAIDKVNGHIMRFENFEDDNNFGSQLQLTTFHPCQIDHIINITD